MNYSITQHNKTDYSLFIKGNSKNILLESIIHLLPFAFIDEEELYFKAENVCSLQDFLKKMDYDQCVNLIANISKQIEFLTKHHFTFIGFNLQDIIVVDEYIFFVSSLAYLYPITNNITFYIPFKKPYFSSPELIQLIELPGSISIKSCYYGLGG